MLGIWVGGFNRQLRKLKVALHLLNWNACSIHANYGNETLIVKYKLLLGTLNFATREIAKNLRTQENCEEHVFKSN